MQRIVIALRPRNRLFVVCRIRINAHHDLGPGGIAIIPSRVTLAYARCGTINRIHMHSGMHRGKRLTKTNVVDNRVIAQFIHKIGTPIPLQTGRVQCVEHAL